MIGKVIKYMRKSRKLRQSDLIKILNIGQSTLSDYENEKISINFETLEKIANECGFKIFFVSDNEKFEAKDLARKDI